MRLVSNDCLTNGYALVLLSNRLSLRITFRLTFLLKHKLYTADLKGFDIYNKVSDVLICYLFPQRQGDVCHPCLVIVLTFVFFFPVFFSFSIPVLYSHLWSWYVSHVSDFFSSFTKRFLLFNSLFNVISLCFFLKVIFSFSYGHAHIEYAWHQSAFQLALQISHSFIHSSIHLFSPTVVMTYHAAMKKIY